MDNGAGPRGAGDADVGGAGFERFWRANEAALQRHARRKAGALRLDGDDADEALCHARESLWERWRAIRRAEALPYAKTSITNKLIDRRRERTSHAAQAPLLAAELVGPLLSPEQQLQEKEDLERAKWLVDLFARELTRDDDRLLLQQVYEGITYEKIAAALHRRSKGTVAARWKKLADRFKKWVAGKRRSDDGDN